ncbi:MAG: hypothetical protein LCH95_10475 [Proteobacteria bacterium]|nr:hypothetical protein [Pseudomonadota bacterium]
MADLFASPRQLISHACDEIKAAGSMIDTFAKSQTGTQAVYVDPVTRQNVFCVRIAGPDLPPKVMNIVKDAAGNLRDALDHSVYAAAVAKGGGEPKHTKFPFAQNAAGVQGELHSRFCSDVPIEIHPLLTGFKPYEGGNDTLWALNQLRNPNTHRFIVPVGSAALVGNLGISTAAITGNSEIGYSRWSPTKKEIEYMRLGPGSTIQHQVSISLGVTFEGIKAIAGKAVIPTLDAMASEVERIVSDIEAECRRVGFIA